MVEGFEKLVVPLASLWAVHNALFYSAGFVNEMRETIVTGHRGNQPLSYLHRRGIFIDWTLCMGATVFVSALFSGILFFVSCTFDKPDESLIKWSLRSIAVYPTVCAGLFAVCAYFDTQLIRAALSGARTAEAEAPSA